MRSGTTLTALFFSLSLSPLVHQPAAAIDVHDTRLLSLPAVSASHIAFIYAEDLWVADLDGRNPRRLTTHIGTEMNPRFSPDGQTLAFSGQYDGNTDVYVVPVEGGVPTRLTWHPGQDAVQAFAPDGSAVMFRSGRRVHTRRHQQLFTVSLEGGMPERLPIPHAFKAAWSPDGSRIAYTPLLDVFNQWKNYRGGTVSRIWIYDPDDHSIEEIPKPEGRCNDTDPMWIDRTLYFRSDRSGEFNLFAYDPGPGDVEQLTFHEEFPIVNASAGGGRIIYEMAGYLNLFDPRTRRSSKLTIGVAADLIDTRPRYAKGAEFIHNFTLSPSGARAAFEFRGEIVTVPAEKGDHRNLSRSPGVCERSPAWSPDGTQIAYFTDLSGEYELHVAAQDGQGEARQFELDGAGFYADPKWSPDGRKLSYIDNSWSLYWIDVETGRITKVSSEIMYGPIKTLYHSWSPDSRWLAYTRNTETNFQKIHVYSLEDDRSYPVTEGLSDAAEPVFDASGKYLYFFVSTDAGPVRQWFAMSNADARLSGSLYLAVLKKGVPSPLAKESDEEEGVNSDGDAENNEDKKNGDNGKKKEEVHVEIDFEGLNQRIVALPIDAASYSNLQPGESGQLYYLKSANGTSLFDQNPTGTLSRFSLEKREEEALLENAASFVLSGDRKKTLVSLKDAWLIADAGGKIDATKGQLSTGDIQVRVEPRTEWNQMFHEAWRINRDYFYDPGMHGADWPAMRDKYAVFLPHLATRSDLNRVLMWMSSELSVGHHRVGGGDRRRKPETIGGGLLGADYDVDHGRYRFAKVYGGLNWNPELRSPLTEPGVDARPGEYLLAVEGQEILPPENLFSRFENTADKIIRITVGPHANGSDSRTVRVVPVASELALRNRDWVEGNVKKVDEATDGRVAYVHVPNTTTLGHTYFKRYFYPQSHKEAIIIDERHNGGGQYADYYIDTLRRPLISYWAMRYGADLKTPQASIQGPKVMLIDETAGSGGDLLPWIFRNLGMGKLIGRRTWGGLVGILGFPGLMDGGVITAPNLAIWTEDGWVVENVGVPPDIEVEQLPARVIAGHDPQLEKAIEVVLEELAANPPRAPRRPAYPVRVRR